MNFQPAISIFCAAALALTAQAATVQVQFIGGAMHDPDGAGFGVGAAQTGFMRVDTMSSNIASGDLSLGASFYTFRLDLTPLVQEGLHAASIADSFTFGDLIGATPVALTPQVAYLYSQFRSGALTHLMDFSQSSVEDLDALQDAIWSLQGLLGSAATGRRDDPMALDPDAETAGPTLSARAQSFVDAANLAISTGVWSGLGSVRIVNASAIGVDAGSESDMNFLAVVVPLPGPAGLALGGLGLAALRRRRSL
ncbi:MAG: hypothetical protein IBJ10_08375 [Phycisphaerales bacterium]|nr:hypothetical protein [Phycisphaerales bacterium]